MNAHATSMRTKQALRIAAVVVAACVVVAAAVALVERYGLTVQAVAYSGAIALLAVASLSDIRQRTVPTWVVVALLMLWVATVWFMPIGDTPGTIGHAVASFVGRDLTAVVLDGLLGAAVVGVGMLAITVAVEVRTGRASFGGGDIKLLFVVGLFLGLPATLTMLLVACLISVVFVMIASLVLPEGFAGHDMDDSVLRLTIPFAPFIALSTSIFMVFGPFTLF